jgi:hypothetical protein
MNAPIKKITAATTFGALPRQLEQDDYERKYNEFKRQRSEMSMPVSAAQNFQGGNMATVGVNPSPQFDTGAFMGDLVKMAMMMAMAG